MEGKSRLWPRPRVRAHPRYWREVGRAPDRDPVAGARGDRGSGQRLCGRARRSCGAPSWPAGDARAGPAAPAPPRAGGQLGSGRLQKSRAIAVGPGHWAR